ncbi:conserved hypothetical protein, partial [Ricinus communis]
RGCAGAGGALLWHRQYLQRTGLFHRPAHLSPPGPGRRRPAHRRHGGEGGPGRVRAHLAQQRRSDHPHRCRRRGVPEQPARVEIPQPAGPEPAHAAGAGRDAPICRPAHHAGVGAAAGLAERLWQPCLAPGGAAGVAADAVSLAGAHAAHGHALDHGLCAADGGAGHFLAGLVPAPPPSGREDGVPRRLAPRRRRAGAAHCRAHRPTDGGKPGAGSPLRETAADRVAAAHHPE